MYIVLTIDSTHCYTLFHMYVFSYSIVDRFDSLLRNLSSTPNIEPSSNGRDIHSFETKIKKVNTLVDEIEKEYDCICSGFVRVKSFSI